MNFSSRMTGYDLQITINGLKVCYHDVGPLGAPTLIFIHGFPLDKSMWQRQIDVLKADYRIVAYDVRGHGGSEAGEEDFSIARFTHDLLCLMETLRIDQAALCGHAMGGFIALHSVANFPQCFNGLILCDTNCVADSDAAKEGRVDTMEDILNDGIDAFADACLARYFAVGSTRHHPEEREKVHAMIMRMGSAALCNTLFALKGRSETCSKLLEIGIPTLILVGEDDAISLASAASLMHSKIRGSTMAIIADAAHLPNLENTVAFNAQLLDFVTRSLPVDPSMKR